MTVEYFDVVIVGAGLSGIGMAYHLQSNCPDKSYVILEGRNAIGGTWDLFRYPGIRSDSEMYTLGYNFKPWRKDNAIADGAEILKYIEETAHENGIERHIRFGYLVKQAHWSSEYNRWTIETENQNTGEIINFSCNFLLMCSGYYSYKNGYTPDFKGRDFFEGKIVHPQQWPQDLNYQDKKVVVVGSGATAMTLVPEIAKDALQVVMLQRSPTYVISSSERLELANFLHKILPEKIAYAIVRWIYIRLRESFYRNARRQPEKVKQKLIEQVRQQLGPDYDVETHFTPKYNPWDQRLCLVLNNDLFKAISSGKVIVVTDHIDTFTQKGILLKSGQELEADIIVTATGLNCLLLGGVKFTVDNLQVDFSQTYTYKGMMYSDVPNLVSTFGYTNTSWTLRTDLTAEYVCQLINYMDGKGFCRCTPQLRDQDRNMLAHSFVENLSSGYIRRVMHLFPKQGDRQPWIYPQNYQQERKMLRHEPINDGVLVFTG